MKNLIEYVKQQFTTRQKTNNMVNDMNLIYQEAIKLVGEGKLSSSEVFETHQVMVQLYSNEHNIYGQEKKYEATSSSSDIRDELKKRLDSKIKSVQRK